MANNQLDDLRGTHRHRDMARPPRRPKSTGMAPPRYQGPIIAISKPESYTLYPTSRIIHRSRIGAGDRVGEVACRGPWVQSRDATESGCGVSGVALALSVELDNMVV